MSADLLPKKRRSGPPNDPQRPNPSSSPSSNVNLKLHPEFWFDDGNIVLVAQRTAFRIYRGLLSSQSTVFSDMFVSSSSSADETFDGCPIIHLSDSPHDVAHLLRVLLPKSSIEYVYSTSSPRPVRNFDEVFALVRLAHKYHIQYVQDQALAALQIYDFTSNFKTFCKGLANNAESLLQKRAQAIGAVTLGRLTNTPSMLPRALYHCAYLGSAVLDGWTRGHGTIEHLSPADLRRCIDGRVTLGQEHLLALSRLFNDTLSMSCTRPDCCRKWLRRVQGFIGRFPNATSDLPLSDWTTTLRRWAEGALCRACEEELVTRHRRERRKIWNKLPKLFDIEIEGWGEPESEVEEDNDDGNLLPL
ncbi:hypothetical protein LXA43DRAFT_901007 [Ganoderma leucocontextum]|nr:hypothetical protein LXA43DRAFT_901007 [Ganoderma leucocontextum]